MKKTKKDLDLIVNFVFRGKKISLQGFSANDWIYKSIFKKNCFYEIDLLNYVRFILKGKEGVIIDIGANIGNHSVFFGSFISSGVICFEPNPNVIPILKRNLFENKINHMLFELGLGDKPGYANVEIPVGHENNIGAAKLLASNTASNISISTLDILLPQIEDFLQGKNILAIKIDVEGMEPNVLKGGIGLINAYRPELFIEVADEKQMHRIEPILKQLGYYKIVSYAATPVWHFSHHSKSSTLNKLLILPYILKDKLKKRLISYARRLIGSLK